MDLESLWDRCRQQRDRRALSRLITLAARGESISGIESLLAAGVPPVSAQPGASAGSSMHSGEPRRVIAVTGSGGVGKSSLIGKLIDVIRRNGRSVAVLACDPQSSLTGGALLGDRIRMQTRADDDGVFIRSLAVPSGHEAIAPHLDLMIRLLADFGFDIVILETAGAGQGDTAVRGVADLVIVMVQPETGDELQWEKAGQLEIADLVVVHKADLPGADRIESQLNEMLGIASDRQVTVIRASSTNGQGVDQLWQVIAQRFV